MITLQFPHRSFRDFPIHETPLICKLQISNWRAESGGLREEASGENFRRGGGGEARKRDFRVFFCREWPAESLRISQSSLPFAHDIVRSRRADSDSRPLGC